MPPETKRFKALDIGDKFSKNDERYRKISDDHAFRLKANGVGETHQRIIFARNTYCDVLK